MYDLTYFDVGFYFIFLILLKFFVIFYITFIYHITFDIIIFLTKYIFFVEIVLFLHVLYHSYLSFFSLPLVCDAFLSHLLLSNVTIYTCEC